MSVPRALRSLTAVVLAAGLLAPGVGAAGSPAAPGSAAVPALASVPDSVARTTRVLVRWTGDGSARASSAATRVRAVGTAAGRAARFVRLTASGSAVYDLGAPLGRSAPRILDRLGRVPGVAHVEADLWMTATLDLPNDPYIRQMWGLVSGSIYSGPGTYGIDAPAAWTTTTGTGVVVAVIDTGILPNHPDLAGQTVPGYDLIWDMQIANDGDGRDSDPSDPGDWMTNAESNSGYFAGWGCPVYPSTWHGTHVAGTIAAVANNGQGVFGGAPGVKILPVRVLGKCGGYLSDIADAIEWASGGDVPGIPDVATPAKVLNLSLGGADSSCPPVYQSAISAARSRGSVIVVAAGNSNSTASQFTPANCSGVITVAAIDKAGKRASFSNFGMVVDVAGPGVGIKSTLNNGATSPNPGGYVYVDYQGTSMATPHVALTAALLMAADPSLTPSEVEALIKANTKMFGADTSLNNCNIVNRCGTGIVNARLAMKALLAQGP